MEEFLYVVEQAPGQISLLLKRTPIEKVLKREDLEPAARRKLELVLDIKGYAEDEVGLVRNSSYAIYTEIERDAVVYNLTATPALSLDTLRWKFPVVGEVPYLGFFSRDKALKKKRELEGQGYDVYVRTAGAYSMLGIVADPLYSPLLRLRESDLANLIIHELVHATVWVEGHVEFNENIAVFIGNQGAYEYCCSRFGKDSEQAVYVLAKNADDRIFSDYINELYFELDELYARDDLPEDAKLKEKEGIFNSSRERFKQDVIPSMSTGRYIGFAEMKLNNAVVVSRKVYYKDLSLYQEIFDMLGSSLPRMVEFLMGVEKAGGNPEAYCRDWLAKRDQPR
jgi:predicted aminopeptidase